MKNLSIASVIEKNKISSENSLVVALDIDIINPENGVKVDRIRLVDYVCNLTIGSNEYVKFPFEIDFKEESGEVQNLTLSLQDQSGVVMPYLREYRGGIGSKVLVRLVTVTPDNKSAIVDFSEVFDVVGSGSSEYVITFELGSENPLSKLCPNRTQMRDRCSFRYKSCECGYKGDLESCDLSLFGKNGCRAHKNSKRFGGYPAITIMRI